MWPYFIQKEGRAQLTNRARKLHILILNAVTSAMITVMGTLFSGVRFKRIVCFTFSFVVNGKRGGEGTLRKFLENYGKAKSFRFAMFNGE